MLEGHINLKVKFYLELALLIIISILSFLFVKKVPFDPINLDFEEEKTNPPQDTSSRAARDEAAIE